MFKKWAQRRAARERLGELFQGAHYVDIIVRRGGKDEYHQGDFLKVLAIKSIPFSATITESGMNG